MPRLRWMLFLHLTFVVSGLLFATMDWVGNRAEKPKRNGAVTRAFGRAKAPLELSLIRPHGKR